MSEINLEMANAVYGNICSLLDSMDIKYQKFEEDFVILFGHKGTDMNHDLLIAVNAKQEVIQVIEKLPFKVDPAKAADIAMAICLVNSKLLCGKFCYDLGETISFEVAQSYEDSLIGSGALKRTIFSLVFSVEEYDDKFIALNKGYLSVEDFKN